MTTKTMLFGPIGRQVTVPYPESGMSSVGNSKAETTDLLSGELSVYRPPLTYKSYNMTWKGSSEALQPFIDVHAGVYGPGPYYITDPMAGINGNNLLPSKWASSYMLGYVCNYWGAPAISGQNTTPEGLQVTFTPQAGDTAEFPNPIVVPTVPGQPLYFESWGSVTGGAGIRVYRYTQATMAWTLGFTITPTLTNDAPTVLVSATDAQAGKYAAIKLVPYLPASSTLTLMHMDVATNDYLASTSLIRRNLITNPSFEAGVPAKSGTMTPTQYALTSSWTPDHLDGSFALKLTPSGVDELQYDYVATGIPVTPGQYVNFAMSASVGGFTGYTKAALFFVDASGNNLATRPATSSTRVGQSVYSPQVVSTGPIVVPDGAVTVKIPVYGYNSDGTNPLAGSVYVDEMILVAGATSASVLDTSYFDGNTQANDNYVAWEGAANASTSIETATPYRPFRTGQGIGPVKFTGNSGGNIDSATIDRIGLSLDVSEVNRDPNN